MTTFFRHRERSVVNWFVLLYSDLVDYFDHPKTDCRAKEARNDHIFSSSRAQRGDLPKPFFNQNRIAT
jgi:hypothetical protein